VPAAPDYAPSLAASGRRRPPQQATPKNSRLGFFGTPSGRTSSRRHLPHGTALGYRGCGYKTASGRPKWLSRDPMGEYAGINLYGYVGGDPINWGDPQGLCPPGQNSQRPNVYIFTEADHGGDWNSFSLSFYIGLVGLNNIFSNNYTYPNIIPVGTKDAPPAPGPITYIVTHGVYDNPYNMAFTGAVSFPNSSGEMLEQEFQNKYGPNHVFYCGKNGGPPVMVYQMANQVFNQVQGGGGGCN